MKFDKSTIAGVVDSVLAILIFAVGKTLVKDAELLGLIKALFMSLQLPFVIWLAKAIGVDIAIRVRAYLIKL